MKKSLFCLLIIMTSLPIFAQEETSNGISVVDAIEIARAWDLADAYYKAGERYLAVGKSKGEDYKLMAFEIFPEYEPGNNLVMPQVDQTPISLENPDGTEDSTRVKEQVLDENAVQIIRYQFSKLVRALISGQSNLLMSILDFPVLSPDFPGGIDKDALESLVALPAGTAPGYLIPTDFFVMDSIQVDIIAEDQYLLTVETVFPQAGLVYSAYTFVKSGLNWKIQAMGENPSPASELETEEM